MDALNEYFRLIVKSGQVEKLSFDASHHQIFSEPWRWTSKEAMHAALALVNRWNHESRGGCVYWIEGV